MRKRIVLTLIAAAMGVLTSMSQLRYGVRLGGDINTTSLSRSAEYKLNHQSGFSGGLTLEYQGGFGPWAADMSLLYTRTGAKFTSTSGRQNAWQAGNDFIELPLHVKYKYWLKSIKELAGPYLYTGPTFMMRVDNENDACGLQTKRFQPGWDVGIGLDVINFIQIQAGYRFGLTNVLKGSESGQMHLRNDGVKVSVALLFDF